MMYRALPWLYLSALALCAAVLGFNGLYGQDAHEYLRQSRVIFERWQGLPAPPPTPGDAAFAALFPLAGALLRSLLRDPVLALQAVSLLAAAAALVGFERLLALLSPGSRRSSRWMMTLLGLGLSPVFIRAGLTSMSDTLGLAFALASIYFSLRCLNTPRVSLAAGAAAFAGLAFSTRYALTPLLLPMGIALGVFLIGEKKWRAVAAAGLAAGLALLPHLWLKTGQSVNPIGHSLLQEWSLWHLFQSDFQSASGLETHFLPNVLYLLFPLAHPAFCLVLPGFFLLAKKTDLLLPAKKLLLFCLLGYLLFLGGLPHQNVRYLLPAYALLLLLLFPAWDRFFCYGLIFFPRLTRGLMAGMAVLQLAGSVWFFAPVLARNRFETQSARILEAALPPGAMLYAFDLDVAMRTYLPEIRLEGLWEKCHEQFPAGSFVVFNEAALHAQWQGQNPMLNWAFLQKNYQLTPRAELPKGWGLWEIE